MFRRFVSFCVIAACAVACYNGTTAASTAPGADVSGLDVPQSAADAPGGDLGDAPIGVDNPSAADTSNDLAEFDAGAQPGKFGWPCQDNAECLSAFCLQGPDGKVCTEACSESCPTGWSCQLAPASDVVYVCVPRFTRLCDPCGKNEDCKNTLAGGTQLCMKYGNDGSYCGVECKQNADCPDGFACSGETSAGKAVGQCRRVTGLCPCSGSAKAAQLTTTCAQSSPWGQCLGKRTCSDTGLSACSAGMPSADLCNGLDDNCNGQTDEDTAPVPCLTSSPAGACTGKTACLDGKAACDGPLAVTETCNGKDDDCDGETDEKGCNDGNPCTEDACNVQLGGCLFATVTKPCDDGNVCTGSDMCKDGKCGGDAVSCDDGIVCTADACGPKGCEHTAQASGSCDDLDPCTGEDKCSLSAAGAPTCAGSALPEGATCTDGSGCTLAAKCAGGKCKSTQNKCDDGNPCTNDGCAGLPGGAAACQYQYNLAACNDGNACSLGDSCLAGSCVGLAKPSCDDLDPCTADTCDAASGCGHAAKAGSSCTDGNVCTTGDACALEGGKAVCKGTALNCDDGNPCTSDACDVGFGCSHSFVAAPCDDGDKCTKGDQCAAGQCVPGVYTCGECLAASDCKPKEDGNLCNGTLFCEKTTHTCQIDPGTIVQCPKPVGNGAECVLSACDLKSGKCAIQATNEAAACDDGNACTGTDTCKGGACAGKYGATACDDGNPCTQDQCDPTKGCASSTLAGVSCNDGNQCTMGDICKVGVCAAGAQLPCTDGNPCTTDGCDPKLGCVYDLNTLPCNDGNACTDVDTCKGGACAGKYGVTACDDGNPCTQDQCDPTKGCASTALGGVSCNDGNQCTMGDICKVGVCAAGVQLPCDDGNPCTTDGCDPKAGCVHNLKTLPSTDGNVCTAGDVCTGAVCMPAKSLDCDDNNPCTTDGCDPKAGCTHAPANGLSCNDGNACSSGDKCNAGQCLGAGQLPCSDGNPCTTDACDPKSGCTFVPNTNVCNDGNACTDGDVCQGAACKSGKPTDCNDANTCTQDLCDPAKGCVYVKIVDATPCNDGDLCTSNDKCTSGICLPGTKLVCNDAEPCTTDICQPKIGCTYTPLADAMVCDDGSVCTVGETCVKAKCTFKTKKDLDGDGHVDKACGGDDCDDNSDKAYPGLAEVCDDLDNDCAKGTDDGCDDDNDDYCDVNTKIAAGIVPKTCTKAGGDCNDAVVAINPGAVEKLEVDVDHKVQPTVPLYNLVYKSAPVMTAAADGTTWLAMARQTSSIGAPTTRLFVYSRGSTETDWTVHAVDDKNEAGATAIFTDATGVPHVFYQDTKNKNLRHATRGVAGWTHELVDGKTGVGDAIGGAVGPGGVLHVAYYDSGAGDLRYANNAGGKWNLTTVDSSNDVGQYAAIGVTAAGAVHIAYLDYTNQDLRHATDAGHPGVFTSQVLDGVSSAAGFYASLAVDGAGKVHVAYYELVASDLRYATNASGSWQTETVDAAGTTGQFTSITATNDGNVHIAYLLVDTAMVRYAVGKAGTWELASLETLMPGMTPAVAVVGTTPQVAYLAGQISPQYQRLRLAKRTGKVFAYEYVDKGATSEWCAGGAMAGMVGPRTGKQGAGDVIGVGLSLDAQTLVRWTGNSYEWRPVANPLLVRPGSMATSAGGTFHACGVQTGSGSYSPKGMAYLTGTWASLAAPVVLDPSPVAVVPCALAMGADGTAHVTWYDFGNQVMRYAPVKGGVAGPTEIPDPSFGTGNAQDIAVAADGSLVVVYGGKNLRVATRLPGKSWVVETLSAEATPDVAVAIDAAGKRYVLRRATGVNGLWLQTWTAGTWSQAVTIPSDVVASTKTQGLSAAVDAGGFLHVLAMNPPTYLNNAFGAWSLTPLGLPTYQSSYPSPASIGFIGTRVMLAGNTGGCTQESGFLATLTFQNLVDDDCDGK